MSFPIILSHKPRFESPTFQHKTHFARSECSELKKRVNFSDFYFSSDVPNLLDVQRNSFYFFLEEGFKTALSTPLLFSTTTDSIEINFLYELIQFQKPEFNEKQAFILGKTFGSAVYIPVTIKSKNFSTVKIEWLLIGVLPLMTKHGHFIINGIPRVVLHQIIRNPGIYTIPRDSRTQTATVRIVPERGGWINLTADKKNRLWFSARSLRRKVSLLIFLQALGISPNELQRELRHSEILVNSYIKDLDGTKNQPKEEGKTRQEKILIRAHLKGHPRTQKQAWRYLYSHFLEYAPYSQTDAVTDESARDFFWNTVWNKEKLSLGRIGRQQFREKVGSTESLEQPALTLQDLIRATQALINLIYKETQGDEIDSLTQKRIRGCDEFLLEALIRGIKEFEVFFSRKASGLPASKGTKPEHSQLEQLWRQNRSVFSKTITKSWKNFFTSGTLAQFMDQTNPLAEATHKRRLTVLGPGGVSSKQTTIQIRGIHPTFYGRLCPIETPEGQNAGLVSSFTVFATPSYEKVGNITTPFYQVYKGQVQRHLPPFRVLPHQEYELISAPADIALTSWNLLPKIPIPVRKELNFDYENSNRITTQSVGILQNISVATSLIPFLEHDDANRALMGSNMQRQAVPLLKPESPLVGTGLETRVVSDVNHVIQAGQSGYLTHVSAQTVQTLTPKTSQFRKSKLNGILVASIAEKTNCLKTDSSSPLKSRSSIFFQDSKFEKNTKDNKQKVANFQKLTHFSLKRNHSVVFSSNQLETKPFFISAFKNLKFRKTNISPLILNPQKKYFFLSKIIVSATQIHRNEKNSNLFLFSTFENSLKLVSHPSTGFLVNTILANSDFLANSNEAGHVPTQNEENKKESPIFSFSENLVTTKTQKRKAESFSKKRSLFNKKFYNLIRYQRTNQSTSICERPFLSETSWVEKGDIIADGAASSRGKLSIGQNVIVAYLPWEGFNFEDAILISQRLVDQEVFTSLHIDHYDIEVKNTQHGLEFITNQIPLKIDDSPREIAKIEKLNGKGLVEIGTWVQEGDYLVGKITPLNPKGPSVEHQYEKLYNVIMQREKTNFRNTSLRVPKGVEGFVLDVQILPSREPDVAALAQKESILRVRIVLLQRRKIQVGDKMAGRHGNKGIISKILPRQDMPYLPDGTPVDIVLNPLGVPSRMNVGQILECLLGLAGRYLQESYTTNLFDEQFGAEASRSLVYSKLYEASLKSKNPWLFEPHHPGKMKIFDGRTGIPFDQPITVGCAYILKLVHLVDDKIHARATGPYSAVTQQPVRGRSRNGGQRLGEMEVWALQAYGAAYTLHELLTIKADDVEGRKQAVFQIYANKPLSLGRPESFKLVIRELQALCFDLQIYGSNSSEDFQTSLPLRNLEKLL